MPQSWSHRLSLREVSQGPVKLTLEPSPVERAAIARQLGLAGLERLRAELTVTSWLDGMAVRGELKADVIYVCGVSLEPFADSVEEEIEVRLVPEGSPLATPPEAEIILDPDGEDPPDLLEAGDVVDLAALAIEHLSLGLDPFPRKPGAVFEPPSTESEASPFAVLKSLKREP